MPDQANDAAHDGDGEPTVHRDAGRPAPPQDPFQEATNDQQLAWASCFQASYHIAEQLATHDDPAYQKLKGNGKRSSITTNWNVRDHEKALLRLALIAGMHKQYRQAASHWCELTQPATGYEVYAWVVDDLLARVRVDPPPHLSHTIWELDQTYRENKAEVVKAALAVASFAKNYIEGKSVDSDTDLQEGAYYNGDPSRLTVSMVARWVPPRDELVIITWMLVARRITRIPVSYV